MVGDDRPLVSVSELSLNKQIVYALFIFERMRPRMVAFCKDTGVDYSCCSEVRDATWSDLESGDQRRALYQALKKACMKNAPDTEDFTHEMTSDALNAFLTMSEIMQFMLDNSYDHIANITALATDSVYLYLADLGPGFVITKENENWIASHPLMQKELQLEKEDIEFLAALSDHFDSATIAVMKERSGKQASIVPIRENAESI